MRRVTVRRATLAVVAVGALTTWVLSTHLFPYHSINHDEGVYLQQAAMLLEGQLNLWPPVEGAFRPWFFVDAGERLYPKYAPVPAAMFAAGRLLGAARLSLVAVAAGNLALVAGVVTEAFDRRTGLLASVFVLCSPLFLLNSAVFLPYAPTALLNLAFAWAYLRADRTGDRRWAAGAGLAVGLAFFARPYTAVLFATPFVAHALWTLRTDWRVTLPRQTVTATLGLAGVVLTLGYNAAVTGSPFVFPYEAFAPLDGLGFGRRRLLGHGVTYTPELALRANARIAALFFGEWVAGGLLGTALAAGGLVAAARRGLDARQAAVAGVAGTVLAGNVYFWGNYNVLGDLDVAGDGLVATLGPYYHFDLLLPTAAFAAVGALTLARTARTWATDAVDERRARVALAAGMLVGAGAMGAVTAADLDGRYDRNMAITETYETAYAPFDGGPPADSVVLLPDPYGDWLNHPFQPLRNDPGFDGRAVYALHDRPFAVADEFPDRTLYRYEYRGIWAPHEGSPDAARLQRVRDVRGERVRVDARVGLPAGTQSVTLRLSADDGRTYHVVGNATDALDLRMVVADGRARLATGGRPVGEAVPVNGREDVRLTAFVDYGAGDGTTYRFDLPVVAEGGEVRALSPHVQWCRRATACDGAAAYVPSATPDGVFVETTLTVAGNTTPKFRSA